MESTSFVVLDPMVEGGGDGRVRASSRPIPVSTTDGIAVDVMFVRWSLISLDRKGKDEGER